MKTDTVARLGREECFLELLNEDAEKSIFTLIDNIERGLWSKHMNLNRFAFPQNDQEVNRLINASLRQKSQSCLCSILEWLNQGAVHVNWDPTQALRWIRQRHSKRLFELLRWILEKTDFGTRLLTSRKGPYIRKILSKE